MGQGSPGTRDVETGAPEDPNPTAARLEMVLGGWCRQRAQRFKWTVRTRPASGCRRAVRWWVEIGLFDKGDKVRQEGR